MIGPHLPMRHRSQWGSRWALIGTVVALPLVAVVVLGFAETTAPRSSVSNPARAFAPAFLPPAIQSLRPRPMHRHKLVTQSTSGAVHERSRLSLQMEQDFGKPEAKKQSTSRGIDSEDWQREEDLDNDNRASMDPDGRWRQAAE